MTERAKGCWVAFDKDYRTDDVEAITNAIQMIKGVLNVELYVTVPDDWMAQQRVKDEMRAKILDLVRDV
jgi:hypothetical protein